MSEWRCLQIGHPVEFRVNGRVHRAPEGQNLAAALMCLGYLRLGRDRRGGPRGVFCGMGVCHGCLVTIDGVPNRRACRQQVRAGMEVVLDED